MRTDTQKLNWASDPRDKSATISANNQYRYDLWRRNLPVPRQKGLKAYVVFVCLNPSIADATQDDPTIRRCVSFATSWGMDAMCMVNLFAFRASDPAKLLGRGVQVIGPNNDVYIRRHVSAAAMVVCAWGANGCMYTRDQTVMQIIRRDGPPSRIYCFEKNKDGSPAHPLYQPSHRILIPYDC